MPLKILLITFILFIPLAPTFWAIQDIPKRRFSTPKKKLTWFLLVSTLPAIGALLYIFFVRGGTQPAETKSLEIIKDQKEVQ